LLSLVVVLSGVPVILHEIQWDRGMCFAGAIELLKRWKEKNPDPEGHDYSGFFMWVRKQF